MDDFGCIEAIKTGLLYANACRESYRDILRCDTKDDVIKTYKKHYQWCLENGFPDLKFIKNEFSGYEDEHIFVGKHFIGETINVQTAIFHNCTGVVNVEMDYEERVIPMLYFANGCDMKVVCRQDNVFPIKVPLYIFGYNSIEANDTSNAIFKRYLHNVADAEKHME